MGYNRKTYLYRKEHNLCTKCNKELEEDRKGKTLCLECSKKGTERVTAYKNFAKDLGMCPDCKKVKLLGDENRCPECRAKHANRSRRWYIANKDKAINNTKCSNRKRYNLRVEQGLCIKCGKIVGDTRFKMCLGCRLKERDYKKRVTELKGRQDWVDNNLCWLCGKDVKAGYKLCEEHYQRLTSMKNNDGIVEYRGKINQCVNNSIQRKLIARS